jgi:hypothetical protein
MFASGSQLAQSRPSGTSAASIFTAAVAHEITCIVVCNTTGSAATYSVYHDDDGSTFDQTTALWYEVSLAGNSTALINFDGVGGGLHVARNGQIGFKTGTGSALTVTLYGCPRGLR